MGYTLTTKNGEAVNKIEASSEESATEYFAAIKNLHIDDLLYVFDVVLDE